MIISKPIKTMFLHFGRDGHSEIHLEPRQKWETKLGETKVWIWHDCVELELPREDFEKFFRMVEIPDKEF